jgi:DNA repair protein SbcC/Rad50
MKKIAIQTLTLLNFKGVANKEFRFGGTTTISGANGTGKTTVADAYYWLLYGKDTSDRKDFSIKPLDAFNEPLHKLTTSVTGVFSVDGETFTLRREYSEKWTKKRGTATEELTGHDTAFFYNDVPLKAGEYDAKIEAIMPSKISKLITSPLYFCTMAWKDARSILIDMAGDCTSSLQFKYSKLIAKLANKSLDEFKKELAAKKKKINDEKESIPARIDELKRANNVDIDFITVAADLEKAKKALVSAEQVVNNNAAANADVSKQIKKNLDVINGLRSDYNNAKAKADKEANQSLELLKDELQKLSNERFRNANKVKFTKEEISVAQELIARTENDMAKLRSDFAERESQVLTIDPSNYCCPTCQREFEAEMKEGTVNKMTENFNNAKIADLNRIRETGLKLKEQNEKRNQELHDLSATLKAYEDALPPIDAKIAELEAQIATTIVEPDYSVAIKIEEQIKQIEEVMPETKDVSPEAKQAVIDIRSEIEKLNKQLAVKDTIAANEKRIEELSNQESTLAQALADLEKEEFEADSYVKDQMEAVSQKVNSMFSLVKFKMYEDQINGGQSPTCVALLDGVPFSDVNTAGKINMGLDIINVLSSYYGISAPIWIDNRESVNDIIFTDSQVVNMLVTKEEKLSVIL